ncbi:MAG: Bax inhibitor-1/YccA family protein [Planctomycetota bacterium]|nr:Bax inhibitor-1/YccA family protein [Planctomycetota bacterium]
MRTANPTFKAFSQPQTWADAHGRDSLAEGRANVMTIGGTVTATSILLGVCVAGAVGSWSLATSEAYGKFAWPVGIGGMIVGLVLALVITFKPKTARFLAPLYAAAEGLFLGVFSFMVGNMVAAKTGAGTAAEGLQIGQTLVLQAITLTFAITAGMLFAYASGIIKPGRVFRAVVISGVIGAMLFGLVAFGLAIFGNSTLISVYSPTNGGMISVGFSVLMVVIASLVLVLDFEFIAKGVKAQLPRHMEWYAGFSLLVTLVWLYIEILRLLAKLRSGD